MNDKGEPTKNKAEFNGRRFQRLSSSKPVSPAQLAKAFEKFKRRHAFRLGFINVLFTILCLTCTILGTACANHDDSTADQSHHHHAHGGNSANGQGSRDSLSLNPSPSSTPVPGL
jgi:hypothetical protein